MQDKIEKIKKKQTEIRHFFKTGIWRIRKKDLDGPKALLLHVARIFVLTANGFQKDNCILRASALTFYTFLSIVPVLAMAFGVSKGFGFEPILERVLMEHFLMQQESMGRIVTFAQDLLEKTKGGVIAGIGLAVLFWTVIKVLSHIEMSLNQIWKVEKSRNIGRKFNDYFAFILICPAVIVLHSSVSLFITVQVQMIMEKVELLGIFSPVIFLLLRMLPYALIWIILTYIYKSIPYTDVNILSAAAGGVLAGTVFQLAQWVYIYFQVGVAQYNAIYGSFAAIPLFMVWLQISWVIVLFGAEFSYAFENVDQYEFEPDVQSISYSQKKLLYLAIAQLITKNFFEAKPALTETQISEELGIPFLFVRKTLKEMIDAGILAKVGCRKEENCAFQPAKDIHFYTVNYILDTLEKKGKDITFTDKSPEIQTLKKSLEKFDEIFEKSPANLHLKDV
ncbi:MAG: YihY/virulence factor BrkB family protein [Desulfobacterales bacterium]